MLVSNNKDFLIYFEGEIFFSNYRNSNLKKGNYLIIKKWTSFSIENWINILPIFSEKDIIVIPQTGDNIKIYKKNDNKEITIQIYKLHFLQEIENWSKNKLTKTQERHIRDELFNNLNQIEEGLIPLQMEYVTEYWNIDILAKKNDYYYIIELKKRQTSLEAVNQVLRYKDFFRDKKTVQIVIGKGISQKAQKFADLHNVKLLDLNTFSFFNTIY